MIIITEAITEIITTSFLMSKVREKISLLGMYWATLIHCGYCLSLWIGLLVCVAQHYGVLYLLFPFVIHRLSNVFHTMIHKPYNFQLGKTNEKADASVRD